MIPQPDWVDLNDEVRSRRPTSSSGCLANLILQMNIARKPLPRFWYFPNGKKAVVVMTGDDHGNGGTAGRFDQFISASPAGCVVANWECVRASYIYHRAAASVECPGREYTAQGFEVGVHINTDCADFTPASPGSFYVQQIDRFQGFVSAGSYPLYRAHIIASPGAIGLRPQRPS